MNNPRNTRQGVRDLNQIGPRVRPVVHEPIFHHRCSAEQVFIGTRFDRDGSEIDVYRCRLCGEEG